MSPFLLTTRIISAAVCRLISGSIIEEKTVDFILELAKVSEKSVTPEELLKAAREAEEAEDEGEPKEQAAN